MISSLRGGTTANKTGSNSDPPLPKNFDMVDPGARDGIAASPYEPAITREPLKKGITCLNGKLRTLYLKADADALKNQGIHGGLANGAILLGFTAIMFAIIQFCILSLSLEMTIPVLNMELVEIFRIGELVAIFLAAGAVCAGLWRAYQNRWLINRHIAERCRLLKFRSLLEDLFWDPGTYETWERRLGEKIDALERMHTSVANDSTANDTRKEKPEPKYGLLTFEKEGLDVIREWKKVDKVPSAHTSSNSPYPSEVKAEFLDYYRKKRLFCQKDYYFSRHTDFKKQSRLLEKIPAYLFFASVGAVCLHFVIDILIKSPAGHAASIILIGGAVTLPVVGYVIKTYSNTFQVAKSSALYYAKYSALEDLSTRLSAYETSIDVNWAHILDTLWQCENFLEAEHREWLNLILDAEWFL